MWKIFAKRMISGGFKKKHSSEKLVFSVGTSRKEAQREIRKRIRKRAANG